MSGVLAGLGWRHAAVPVGIVCVAAVFVSSQSGADIGTIGNAFAVGGLILLAWLAVASPVAAQAGREGAIAVIVVSLLFLVNLIGLSLPRIGFFAELDWNWQGKTLDLVWCLLLIGMLSPQMRREIGWTLATRPGTLPVAFINIAILAIAGFALLGGGSGQELTLERVLFDTTHPNLVEEIVFRGFMLALLDRAFGTRWTFGGARWTFGGARIGWGVVLTAWLFGLVHGIALDADGALVFSLPYLLLTFIAGLVLGWIRALTGSLWPAFLAHAAPEAGIFLALAVR